MILPAHSSLTLCSVIDDNLTGPRAIHSLLLSLLQAIAQALGGQVKAHGQKTQAGACSFRPNATAEALFGFCPDKESSTATRLLYYHNDIVTALPEHAEALASGPIDPHPMCIYRTSPQKRPHIVTIQVRSCAHSLNVYVSLLCASRRGQIVGAVTVRRVA